MAAGGGSTLCTAAKTRAHRDLDLAVHLRDVEGTVDTLTSRGYMTETDWQPVRVEMINPAAGWVDLHPVDFDESGYGRQADMGGGWFEYPPGSFAFGTLGGVVVPCLSRNKQLQFRRGYELRDVDRHDIQLLNHVWSSG